MILFFCTIEYKANVMVVNLLDVDIEMYTTGDRFNKCNVNIKSSQHFRVKHSSIVLFLILVILSVIILFAKSLFETKWKDTSIKRIIQRSNIKAASKNIYSLFGLRTFFVHSEFIHSLYIRIMGKVDSICGCDVYLHH